MIKKRFHKIYILFFLILIGLWQMSCEKTDCIPSDKIYTNEFTLPEGIINYRFNHIFELEIIEDTLDKIIIKADENNIDNISFAQDGNWLEINNSGICDVIRSEKNIPKLEIHARAIDTLDIREPCHIYNQDTLYYEKLVLNFYTDISSCDLTVYNSYFELTANTTSGLYHLSGHSYIMNTTLFGSNQLQADDFHSYRLIIKNASTVNALGGDCSEAFIWIYGAGNVILKSVPDTMQLYKYSSGELIFQNTEKNNRVKYGRIK